MNKPINPPFLQTGSAFRSALLEIGFKEIKHFTITNSLIYDLGHNRQLSFGSIETPNEMLYICEIDRDNSKKITDLICLKNYDYDKYTTIEQIKSIITSITSRVF